MMLFQQIDAVLDESFAKGRVKKYQGIIAAAGAANSAANTKSASSGRYWLSMGLAWYMEMEQIDGIYCFPYRTGFVSSGEHENWNKLNENRLRRRKEPLTMRELAALKRGTWDTNGAHLAWGVVSFLVRFHPEAMPEILDELYTLWDEQGRSEDGDGNWERIPGFEPDLKTQLAVFEKHVPDFLSQLLKYFAKGKLYKP